MRHSMTGLGRRTVVLGLAGAAAVGVRAQTTAPARELPPFQGTNDFIATQLTDVQSVVVMQKGRVVHGYYRDGDPNVLRDVQSVNKSLLSLLTGIALGQRLVASLDQPVVEILPEWASLNRDPRAATITVRHLLTMTAGFAFDDPTGTGNHGKLQDAWKRPLRNAPGDAFAYDNAAVPMLGAVLEKSTGMPLADYARRELVTPLGLAEPAYDARGTRLRTEDLARLGQLALQKGVWEGRELIPESYVMAATQVQNRGGAPVGLPYGYMWWVVPSDTARPTFFASGYGGQLIWVHPPLELVIASTSTVSADSARRGQSLQLIRARLFAAAQKQAAS